MIPSWNPDTEPLPSMARPRMFEILLELSEPLERTNLSPETEAVAVEAVEELERVARDGDLDAGVRKYALRHRAELEPEPWRAAVRLAEQAREERDEMPWRAAAEVLREHGGKLPGNGSGSGGDPAQTSLF